MQRQQEIRDRVEKFKNINKSLRVNTNSMEVDESHADIKYLLDALEQAQESNKIFRQALEEIRTDQTFSEVQMYGSPLKKYKSAGVIANMALVLNETFSQDEKS